MPQDSEHIEARLCAYIDGDLAPDEVTEIEKHLAANPAHQRLVAELKHTRELVQALPMVSAPAGLNDTLHARLERQALIADDAELDAPVAGRIRRWPQLLSVAAILFLALGLAAIVFSVLPRGDKYAINPPAATTGPEVQHRRQVDLASAQGDKAVKAADQADPSKSALNEIAKDAKGKLQAPVQPKMQAQSYASRRRGGSSEMLDVELDRIAQRDSIRSRLRDAISALDKLGLPGAFSPSFDALFPAPTHAVVVVEVTDVDAARKALSDYLAASGLGWSDIPRSELPRLDRALEKSAMSIASQLSASTAPDTLARNTDATPDIDRHGPSTREASTQKLAVSSPRLTPLPTSRPDTASTLDANAVDKLVVNKQESRDERYLASIEELRKRLPDVADSAQLIVVADLSPQQAAAVENLLARSRPGKPSATDRGFRDGISKELDPGVDEHENSDGGARGGSARGGRGGAGGGGAGFGGGGNAMSPSVAHPSTAPSTRPADKMAELLNSAIGPAPADGARDIHPSSPATRPTTAPSTDGFAHKDTSENFPSGRKTDASGAPDPTIHDRAEHEGDLPATRPARIDYIIVLRAAAPATQPTR